MNTAEAEVTTLTTTTKTLSKLGKKPLFGDFRQSLLSRGKVILTKGVSQDEDELDNIDSYWDAALASPELRKQLFEPNSKLSTMESKKTENDPKKSHVNNENNYKYFIKESKAKSVRHTLKPVHLALNATVDANHPKKRHSLKEVPLPMDKENNETFNITFVPKSILKKPDESKEVKTETQNNAKGNPFLYKRKSTGRQGPSSTDLNDKKRGIMDDKDESMTMENKQQVEEIHRSPLSITPKDHETKQTEWPDNNCIRDSNTTSNTSPYKGSLMEDNKAEVGNEHENINDQEILEIFEDFGSDSSRETNQDNHPDYIDESDFRQEFDDPILEDSKQNESLFSNTTVDASHEQLEMPTKAKNKRKPLGKSPSEETPLTIENDNDENGKRKGQRKKFRPLEYWKNERIVYKLSELSSKLHVPDVKEVITMTPNPSPSQLAPNTVAAKRKLKQLGYKERDEAIGKVLGIDDKGNEQDIDKILMIHPEKMNFKNVPNNGYKLFIGFVEDNFPLSASAGVMAFQKDGYKALKNSGIATLFCTVVSGVFQITIYKTSFIATNGCQFIVPKGNQYEIKNLSSREAKISYTHFQPIQSPPVSMPETTTNTQEMHDNNAKSTSKTNKKKTGISKSSSKMQPIRAAVTQSESTNDGGKAIKVHHHPTRRMTSKKTKYL